MTDVKDTRTLTLEGALKVLNAAIAEATRIGQPMCIAVVDTGGNLLAFGRMDGSKGLSVTSSINKARTSALSGAPTGGAHANVEIQVTLAHESRWTNLIGGLPIRVDGFILGAVAAGSGNGSEDLAVARAGAAIPGAEMCLDFIAMGAQDSNMIPGSRPRGDALKNVMKATVIVSSGQYRRRGLFVRQAGHIRSQGHMPRSCCLDDRFQESCHMGGIHLPFRAPI
jgi:glc operon protein GlcG